MAALTAPAFTKAGAKAAAPATLDASVFGILPENYELLKLAYDAYLANGRDNLAVTKTRGLVRGGGRKPYKQKGTGRARAGSTRSPIWRGGGTVFGPTGEENYTKKVPVAIKRQAIRQALSLAAAEKRIKVVAALDFTDGKTATAQALLQKLDAGATTLLVTNHKDDMGTRAVRNLTGVKLTHAPYLNTYDILNADTIIVTQKSLEAISVWLGGTK